MAPIGAGITTPDVIQHITPGVIQDTTPDIIQDITPDIIQDTTPDIIQDITPDFIGRSDWDGVRDGGVIHIHTIHTRLM